MANKPQTLNKGQKEEIDSIIQEKIKDFRSKIWNFVLAVATFCSIFGSISLWGIWKTVERKMENLVAKQFEEPQIKMVVREAAAERASVLMGERIAPEVTKFKTDVAGQLKESQALLVRVARESNKAEILSQEVSDKNARAETKLKVLDQSITESSATLVKLEAAIDFIETVVAAQNDNRKAFDKLATWSKDKSHPFCERAKQAWLTITKNTDVNSILVSGFNFPWAKGIDPSKLSLAELTNCYQTFPTHIKPALLEYIWKREDIAKIERLDFLMTVMQQDESLNVVECAGRFFTDGTKQNIYPLAVEHLSNWWKEHRNEFVKEGTDSK